MKIIKEKGFTLIEVMIVVVIIGIISAIALPSYLEHVRKAKRTEAKTELLKIAQMQESYFVQHLSYAKDLSQLGFNDNALDTETGLYEVKIDVRNPDDCDSTIPAKPCKAYAVTASIKGGQAGDTDCSGFRLDHIGRKWAIGSTGSVSVSEYPGAGGPSDDQKAKSKTCWK